MCIRDSPKGPHGHYGVPLLRELAQDNDSMVWTLARSLLARLLTPEDAPIVEPTLPPRRSAFSAEPPKTATPEPDVPTGTATGKLIVTASGPVLFQVGKRQWQAAPATLDLMVEMCIRDRVYALRLDRGLSDDDVLQTVPGTYWDRERGLTDHQYIVPGGGGLGEVLNNSFV